MGTVRAPTIIDLEDPTFCWKCPKISVEIVGSLMDQDKRIKQLRVGAKPVSSSCTKVVQKQERPDIELCTTRIKNIDAISEALDWPPRCIARWLGKELGAMVTCIVKEEGSCCILTGAHKRSVCQAALDRFVDEYIHCGNCGVPGVATVVPQDGLMCGLCGTCGWAGQLENKHQLAKFLMYEFEENPSQLDDEENGVIVVRTLLDEILGYETKGALGTGSMQWGALFGDNKMKTEKKDKKEKKEKKSEDKDEKKEKKEKKDEKKEKKEKKDGKENKENKEKEKKVEPDNSKKKKGEKGENNEGEKEKKKKDRGERDAHVIR